MKTSLGLVLTGILALLPSQMLLARNAEPEQFTLGSADGRVKYHIQVSLPNSYATGNRQYPLLVMLDGDYAFDSAAQISEYLQRSGEVEEFVIAAVSYGVGFGKPLAVERTRDFTPPIDEARRLRKAPNAYAAFLKEKLLPELQRRYRVAHTGRALWGYSLSASFVAWLNYHDPELFDHYILASGNLTQFGIERNFFAAEIFNHPQFSGRKVVLSFDATEVPDPSLVESARKLVDSGDVFKGYDVRLLIGQGETHVSSWFVALPASLRHVFGRRPAHAPSTPQAAAD